MPVTSAILMCLYICFRLEKLFATWSSVWAHWDASSRLYTTTFFRCMHASDLRASWTTWRYRVGSVADVSLLLNFFSYFPLWPVSELFYYLFFPRHLFCFVQVCRSVHFRSFPFSHSFPCQFHASFSFSSCSIPLRS